MNTLETVRSWLATFPQFDVLSGFQVDFTDKIPCTGGILPDGLVEVSRKRDIVGNVTVTNQYNFEMTICLRQNTVYAFLEIFFNIIYRHNN